MKLSTQELDNMTINELESLSHQLTAMRQEIRGQALMVQDKLSERIEAQRIEKMLGKPVATKIIAPDGIQSDEAVNELSRGS